MSKKDIQKATNKPKLFLHRLSYFFQGLQLFTRSRVSGIQTPQGIGGGGAGTHSWDVSSGEAVVSSAPCGWPGDSHFRGWMSPKFHHPTPEVGHWGILGSPGSVLGVLGVGSNLLGSFVE